MQIIEPPYTKKKERPIYNPSVEVHGDSDIDIMRIVQEEELTRIDFAYRSSSKYIKGGWVQIDSETFIRPVNTGMRLTLVQAVNIPIAPKKHWFRKK